MKKFALGVLTSVTLLSFTPAYADDECQSAADQVKHAIDNYNSVLNNLTSSLISYDRCVSSSVGQDDCNSKFRDVRDYQNSFESAVSDYQTAESRRRSD